MPDAHLPDPERADRTEAERAADHAAIERLAEGVLPALIAKLGATGLGELEVREGPWRVRLRRPTDGRATDGRAADSRAPGSAGRDKRRDRGERSAGDVDRTDGTRERGTRTTLLADVGTPRSDARHVATSPAVGIYRPRTDLAAGTRVRAGDRLGAVDMLGVAQEVVAPADGIVGASLADSGDAVEYGQQLLVIEFGPTPASSNGSGS